VDERRWCNSFAAMSERAIGDLAEKCQHVKPWQSPSNERRRIIQSTQPMS